MGVILDGGYYAIKGFNFQYDYTLLRILEQSNISHLVEIEQFEDYSDENYIVQVKYKEKTDFSYSRIKKPVCQLLEMFKTDKRTPVLYSYFKNKGEEAKRLTFEELNKILGDCRINNKQYYFSEELKLEFISKFLLIFTQKYQDQFEKVIDKIKTEFSCEEDEALIYYAQMYKYIEKKVVENPPSQKAKRICSKDELIRLIKQNRKIIFQSSYIEFMGKEKYYRLINKKYFREINRNYHERIFIIQVPDTYNVSQLKKIVLKLRKKFYLTSEHKNYLYVKSPAPYILFDGVKKEDLREIKLELQMEGYKFSDGFNFENAAFFLQSLIAKSSLRNNVEIKFINDFKYLTPVLTSINNVTKKVYYFYLKNKQEIDIREDIIYIQQEDFSDIYEFLF